ncbi:hypothetical protein EDEG_02502 [Edhazardia aedis USNM 41457]|uniref:Uncharacterized protein n=1 Tax=Edhazardia aedis (strain USNM 41457) TaxID=1003232 RepID=J9D5R8_EDHAE|nr:hypothetical protein EDEG_02502 [Edhazardia aedis USNM 41457]|eukprot:EJW03116.1 hypothetical protein EDEG_02502 [Edhazardia aedis USNM 41457]
MNHRHLGPQQILLRIKKKSINKTNHYNEFLLDARNILSMRYQNAQIKISMILKGTIVQENTQLLYSLVFTIKKNAKFLLTIYKKVKTRKVKIFMLKKAYSKKFLPIMI